MTARAIVIVMIAIIYMSVNPLSTNWSKQSTNWSKGTYNICFASSVQGNASVK